MVDARAERQSYVTMNETIAAIARKHPELTVLDWNAVSRENPAWLQPDGIHLTPAGANGMAAMVNDALVRLGAALPATPTPKPAVKAKRKFLAITSQALPVARTGRLYSVRLHATGGTSPYRWMRTGGILVPGLRLTVDGRLAGRATRPGTFKLRLRVVDRAGAARARILSCESCSHGSRSETWSRPGTGHSSVASCQPTVNACDAPRLEGVARDNRGRGRRDHDLRVTRRR